MSQSFSNYAYTAMLLATGCPDKAWECVANETYPPAVLWGYEHGVDPEDIVADGVYYDDTNEQEYHREDIPADDIVNDFLGEDGDIDFREIDEEYEPWFGNENE